MSQKNNDISYTAADIEKYHKGLLSSREMHALEKAALDDPFLADALEGYATTGINSNADMADLKNRLAKRIEEDSKVVPIAAIKKTSFAWWKIAAMIVVVAGAGILVYQSGFNNKAKDIAQAPAQKAAQAETNDSSKEKADLFLNTDSNTSSAAKEQEDRDKSTADAKPANETSPAPANETPVTIKADAASSEKDLAASTTTAPAAPSAIQGKKEEQALNERDFKKIQPTKDDYATRIQSAEKAVPPVDTLSSGFYKNAQEPLAQNAAKARQMKIPPTHTNVFRGRITDGYNNALPFSNITNTEDNIGTYSDAKGYFVLTSPDSVLNVQVSSVGFEPSKIQLQNNVPANNITLQEDRSLAEVVLSNKKVNSKSRQDANMILEDAEPADGWNNYDLYLVNNLKTPDVFKDKQSDVKGEVVLSFEVDKTGTPYNITVKKSLCESCDKEAIRLIKEGPKWKRKAKKGKATVKIAF